MKRQKSIFIGTLQCIFAGFCSGFFFNLVIILIVMLVSNGLGAETSDDVTKNEIVIEKPAEVIPEGIEPEEVKHGSLLFKNNQGFIAPPPPLRYVANRQRVLYPRQGNPGTSPPGDGLGQNTRWPTGG
ncbi:MAG: hypothetical protein IIC11_00350 [Proteobacteria bacterium]|nr:hypothetical protein [Pseudomonadota bacterium]